MWGVGERRIVGMDASFGRALFVGSLVALVVLSRVFGTWACIYRYLLARLCRMRMVYLCPYIMRATYKN